MVDDIKPPENGGRSVDVEPEESSNEPSFTPPELIAQDEEDDAEVIDMAETQSTEHKAKQPRHKFAPFAVLGAKFSGLKSWWKSRSKIQKIIISVAIILVLSVLVGGGYMLFGRSKPAPPAPTTPKAEVKEVPKPTTEASHLTGVQVPLADNLLPVTGIMIENSPDARPQSGLKDAGVVFEAVAEGGITRFLTLFQEAQPDYVGPVRSVRPYYLEWLEGFDAPVAHVGGSPVALAKIRSDGVKDLDQSFNSGSYHRVTNRYAPHNVYTSLANLIALSKSKGVTGSTFTGFLRKADKPEATPTAKSINFDISGPLYKVHYDYSAATNSYLRSLAGAPHKDERSGQQINPKVVIALVMPKGIDPDGVHTTYNTIGTGTVYIFQDGTVTQGKWSKASDKEQFKFTDASGSPLGLNAGQTWLTVLGLEASVTYTP